MYRKYPHRSKSSISITHDRHTFHPFPAFHKLHFSNHIPHIMTLLLLARNATFINSTPVVPPTSECMWHTCMWHMSNVCHMFRFIARRCCWWCTRQQRKSFLSCFRNWKFLLSKSLHTYLVGHGVRGIWQAFGTLMYWLLMNARIAGS